MLRNSSIKIAFVLLILAIGTVWVAPTRADSTNQTPSLDQLINNDGTLKIPAGFAGAIDSTGYQLVSHPGEAPRFARVPQTPDAGFDNANWDPRFNTLGTNGAIRAMLWDGNNLYIGGSFIQVGGITVNRIARWNGTGWSALGTGMNNLVQALAWDGTNLYAGGTFTTADGNPANRVAMWNGTAWSALSAGTNAQVFALVMHGGNLYAGGSFTSPASRIAMWDGVNWNPLGAGTNGSIRALASDGTNLYVGGTLTTAGGNPANRVAMWDGANWNPLGAGTNDTVFALAWGGTDLYVGGQFTSPASRIARWDGSSWNALGGVTDGTVRALAWDGVDLYAGGAFLTAGGTAANRVARWNGVSWNALGSGANNAVWALAYDDTSLYDSLYGGGDFTQAGGKSSLFVGRWRIAAIWDNGGSDGIGSNAANWSGNIAPVSTDVAIFDSTSIANATLDPGFTTALVGLVMEDTYLGTITHANNLAISEQLNVYNGTLIVADPSITTLTVGGSVNQTGGVMQQTRPVNNADVPLLQITNGGAAVKYRGVEIDTTGTGANLGGVTTRIRAIDTTAGEYCTQQGPNSYLYIRRCYEITPTTDGAANLQLWYLFIERAGGNVNQMGIFRDTTGSGDWVLLNNRTTGGDGGAYRFATGDTPGFSHFLVANAGYSPTAVTLQTFAVTPVVVPVLVLLALLGLAAVSTVVILRRRSV